MKTLATLIAGLVATAAFAAEPAKKEEAKPATPTVAATTPAAPAATATKSDAKAAPAKKDDKKAAEPAPAKK
jgi:hypothetical protein